MYIYIHICHMYCQRTCQAFGQKSMYQAGDHSKFFVIDHHIMYPRRLRYGRFLSHRGTPSHHPSFSRIFPYQPAVGVPPWRAGNLHIPIPIYFTLCHRSPFRFSVQDPVFEKLLLSRLKADDLSCLDLFGSCQRGETCHWSNLGKSTPQTLSSFDSWGEAPLAGEIQFVWHSLIVFAA